VVRGIQDEKITRAAGALKIMPVLSVNPATCRPEILEPAVDWLRAGGVVAMPTDTFYGLAVDPTSATAVRAVFGLKGRSRGAALPLVAGSFDQVLRAFGDLQILSRRLATEFWPGPLSLVVDAPASLDAAVHGGRRTVAVRVPDHRVTRTLALAWGAPLTATSANRSGAPPARSVDDLSALSAGDGLFVIDGGVTAGGAASTIVDARQTPVTLVREGAVSWNRVLESLRG